MLRLTNNFNYKICEKGHLIYSHSGPVSDKFCNICGKSFVTECAGCATPLKSTFESPVNAINGEPTIYPNIPGACTNCGFVFPWTNKPTEGSTMSYDEALGKIKKICSRFHNVVKQLRQRYNDRETIEIEDEYDVQDVLHSLLKIEFDDIRTEEWAPSYAGGAARVDFLVKPHMILIEVKKTRKGLTSKKLGDQLIEDIARYKQIDGVQSLVCFIYDPEERIQNSSGLITDLESLDKEMDISVIITPNT